VTENAQFAIRTYDRKLLSVSVMNAILVLMVGDVSSVVLPVFPTRITVRNVRGWKRIEMVVPRLSILAQVEPIYSMREDV